VRLVLDQTERLPREPQRRPAGIEGVYQHRPQELDLDDPRSGSLARPLLSQPSSRCYPQEAHLLTGRSYHIFLLSLKSRRSHASFFSTLAANSALLATSASARSACRSESSSTCLLSARLHRIAFSTSVARASICSLGIDAGPPCFLLGRCFQTPCIDFGLFDILFKNSNLQTSCQNSNEQRVPTSTVIGC
ncbi:hypothetical protein Ciccas_010892, partial [Cichlidogyrus casuarinus]